MRFALTALVALALCFGEASAQTTTTPPVCTHPTNGFHGFGFNPFAFNRFGYGGFGSNVILVPQPIAQPVVVPQPVVTTPPSLGFAAAPTCATCPQVGAQNFAFAATGACPQNFAFAPQFAATGLGYGGGFGGFGFNSGLGYGGLGFNSGFGFGSPFGFNQGFGFGGGILSNLFGNGLFGFGGFPFGFHRHHAVPVPPAATGTGAAIKAAAALRGLRR
jgi:hypothetical protein